MEDDDARSIRLPDGRVFLLARRDAVVPLQSTSVVRGLLHDALFLPTPEIPQHRHGDLLTDAGADDAACEQAIALLERHADELAALVVEPLVQCAGRMRMTGSGFLRRIADAAQSLGIHLVTDEIATIRYKTEQDRT